ncbi:MAG: serine/threonine protein kinase [Labilithrix sp.]|nr:serine/threonine protein kinase [Labilithrix sp.]
MADPRRGAHAQLDWYTLGPDKSVWDAPSPKRTARLVDGLAGRVLVGRYRLGRLLDDAALCATYEAYEIETGRQVAVELVTLPRNAGPLQDTELRREAARIMRVTHPGLRTVRGVGSEGGAPFIVADPVAGESLRDRIVRKGPLRPEVGVAVALQIIEAIGAAHAAGLVHANLKPEKIRLRRNRGGRAAVTVMGLGVSTLLGTLRDVDTRGVGTPPYLAPEQLSGFGTPDELTDVWGVGLLLFEAITGQRAFDGSTADEVGRRIACGRPPALRRACPAVPVSLDWIVAAALARRREHRLSLRDLHRALGDVRAELAHHVTPKPRNDIIVDCSDPCDDVEGTTDLHVFVDTDLGAL